MTITLHEGDRGELVPLFRLADDSDDQIQRYLDQGEVLFARDGDSIVGHLQLITTAEPQTLELKSLAVVENAWRKGIGRALVAAAIDHCRQRGIRRLTVSTAAADIGNLRFYQRVGFRMLRIERDAFGPHNGYPADRTIDGIPLRDRIIFDREL